MKEQPLKKVENIVVKVELAHYEKFLLLLHVFTKVDRKHLYVGKGLNYKYTWVPFLLRFVPLSQAMVENCGNNRSYAPPLQRFLATFILPHRHVSCILIDVFCYNNFWAKTCKI